MANRVGAYAAVAAGGLIVYSAVTGKKVIDVLLMRGSTLSKSPPQAGTNVSADSGSRDAVVQAAQAAVDKGSGSYTYSPTRPYPPNLYGPPLPVKTDCSGFATLCYKEAGCKDPNGLGYSGQGYTGTLLLHGKQTNQPQPGDLCFWRSPDHVAVFIGNGNIIEFGGPPAPIQNTVDDEHKYHAAFLGYRSYLP